MSDNKEHAKAVITQNSKVPFGIFGAISKSRCFPTRELLNEFLMSGYDACDQDQRMPPWPPFALTTGEYEAVTAWWKELHSEAVASSLGASSWSEWSVALLESFD